MLQELNLRNRFLGMMLMVIVCMMLLAFLTVSSLNTMYKMTSRVYEDPLNVSSTATEASRMIMEMDRDMKNVILFNDSFARDDAIQQIDALENKVYEQLDLIKDQMLKEEGKELVDEAYESFKGWQLLRENIIGLVLSDRRAEAAVLAQGMDVEYVEKLDAQFLALKAYARQEAEQFIAETTAANLRAVQKSLVIFTTALAVALMMIGLMIHGVISELRDLFIKIESILQGESVKDTHLELKGNHVD